MYRSRLVGNFSGVLIFVTFMIDQVNWQSRKISTYEN